MRLAVAGFQHETNTFAAAPAEFAEFEKRDAWPGLLHGGEILETTSGRNIPIGGFLEAAKSDRKVEIAPILWCAAEPCAQVTTDAFERISGMIVDGLERAGSLDGIYLDLHGAMVTEEHQDGEGELLRRVRALVGQDLPVAVSLDLHANVTAAMVEAATVMTGFRTYPHIDMAETGARALPLLKTAVRDGPYQKAFRQAPYLVPAIAQYTGAEPGRSLYNRLPGLATAGVTNVELLMGFESADIADAGPSLVAYGTDSDAIEAAANSLFRALLAAESDFRLTVLEPHAAVRVAMAHEGAGPVIIADVHDNPGGGAPSDTVGMLHALVSEGARGAVLGLLHDPEVAAAAYGAGEGATLDLALGGKSRDLPQSPFHGRFLVERIGNGRFAFTGPILIGSTAELGPMALLRFVNGDSEVRVAVGSRRCQCLDSAIFRHLGVEPREQRIVVVKSCVHFRADFEPIASAVILAEAPGVTTCRLEGRGYRNLRPGVRLGPGGPAFEAAQ